MIEEEPSEELTSSSLNGIVVIAHHCCKSSLSLVWPTTAVCRCRIEQGRVIVAHPCYPPRLLTANRIQLFNVLSV